MKHNFWPETIISILLVVITFMLFKPMYLLMPESTHSTVVFSLVIIFIIFAVFVWKERGRDEREIQHKYFAGRFAYLVGSGTLVLGIVAESLKDNVDIWLLIALLAMTIGKVAAQVVSQMRN